MSSCAENTETTSIWSVFLSDIFIMISDGVLKLSLSTRPQQENAIEVIDQFDDWFGNEPVDHENRSR